MTGGGSSIPEVRRLIATLVASKPAARIAETGTAFGLAARAIVDAMGPQATFVTVELDTGRYATAVGELANAGAVVLNARWQEVLPSRAPFDLIFFDSDAGETDALELALSLLAPGGILIKDDLTPGRPIDGDIVRERLLRDDSLIAAEVMTTLETAAIIAVRRL